jgi:hypothetical protein
VALLRPVVNATGVWADDVRALAVLTRGRDLGERFAEKRIEPARFERRETSRIERQIPVGEKEGRRVPDQARRFPRLHQG